MNTMLMILDGYGINSNFSESAIAQANKPNLDRLFSTYPNTIISASGLAVGLPEGQMGNSEVGHLNIGAGRVVYQELTRITKEIKEGTFFQNSSINAAMDHAFKNNSSLHLMGLLSDGGVHSHISHLFALIDLAKRKGLKKVYVHAFLDGRDVPPRCAAKYIDQLEAYMENAGVGKIAMISGRYYAMDRDKRWERVQKAYDALTQGKGEKASCARKALELAYDRDENDEFVLPTVIMNGENPVATINDNDGIIMFNFRPDRAREITRCFVDDNFNGFDRILRPKNISYVCMTQYDAEMPNVMIAFPPQTLKNTLGEYLSGLGLLQLRIAETEKYAHVTFFFNGGIEAPNNGEERILIPSPKVATYDLKPEMSAYEVTDRAIEIIKEKKYDFIILNFANPDMVGHTGVMEATIKAIEVLDDCVGRIVNAIQENDGQLLLTSDHGNADWMLDKEGNVATAHSLNPVPFLIMTEHPVKLAEGGILADIAPTLLDLTNIEKPKEMTGRSLLL
ncbi:MAG: 2,3-bisphosphoglycerate-independent phosphoglycerate mutase [Anaerovoracaceae bacterium]|jgi:2,3-bisphosphoglycerate-independent phosphoglycerate mutase